MISMMGGTKSFTRTQCVSCMHVSVSVAKWLVDISIYYLVSSINNKCQAIANVSGVGIYHLDWNISMSYKKIGHQMWRMETIRSITLNIYTLYIKMQMYFI